MLESEKFVVEKHTEHEMNFSLTQIFNNFFPSSKCKKIFPTLIISFHKFFFS